VTVQSQNSPIRNSRLPNNMTDLANFIGLKSRWACTSLFRRNGVFTFCHF